MPVQLLINLCIAFLWMFLQDDWSIISFSTGYIIGLIVIYGLRRFFPSKFYPKTLWAVLKLLIIFVYELIDSGILVVKQVMRPRINVTPGIFRLQTDLESDWEITLLSMLITLTPGSLVMEVSPDRTTLYVHAMDIPESRDVVIQAQKRFEKAIKEVFR